MGVMRKRITIVSAIGIALYAVFLSVPLLLLTIQSIRPRIYMFTDPPTFIFRPTSDHFVYTFSQDVALYLSNSFVIAFLSTLLCLVIGSMCAYSLSGLRLRGKYFWAVLILMTRMIPAGSLMIPLYVIIRNLGLLNTHLAVILTHATLNLPFAIWMLRSFFTDVPKELVEAAMIDGCSRIKAFVQIVLPLSAAGLAATGVLSAIFSWNEFMFAQIFTNAGTRTIPVWISGQLNFLSRDWGGSSAMAVVACVPIFIAGIAVQKYLVRGLTMGAIKG